jgi:hypothetical protein
MADMQGIILIKPAYQSITSWHKNIYRVKSNNKWGLCDENGQLISECKYDSIDVLINGKAKITLVNPLNIAQVLTGYINSEGEVLYEQKIEQLDGLFIVQQYGRWGIVDSDNKSIIQSVYEDVKPWSESLYRIKQNQKWGIINITTNEYLKNPEYDYISELVSGVAKVSYVGVESHIDVTGQEVLQEKVELQSGLLKTKKSGKWGIIREDGTEVIAHKYDEIGSFRGRLIGVINKRITKLDAYYDYPIYVSGKYIYSLENNKKVYFSIGGVNCYLAKAILPRIGVTIQQLRDNCGVCDKLAFSNLIVSKQNYEIRYLKDNQLTRP